MASAAVAGTGLIGASVGMALRAGGWRVVGWDPEPATARRAAELGALDAVADDRTDAMAGADLVVLAGPPAAVVATLPELATDALVTDVAGIKAPVVAAAGHLPHFVGGHPMAGRELSGPEAASGALFRGAAWVLATDGAEDADLDRIEAIVAGFGARPLRMTADAHDGAVAAISHLPQVLAAALLREAAASPAALELASGSFRDLTRVASSDPDAWAPLLVGNPATAATVRRFAARLEAWAAAVEAGDRDALRAALGAAREARAELAPPVSAVQVALADRPGELARVGRALESSQVDVRDLQLRHAPHGGGGILSLFVHTGEREALRAALASEGLLLAEGP